MARGVIDMGVVGMGGLFFRADDPEALSAWYVKHLWVGPGCGSEAAGPTNPWSWTVEAGPMVFAPFKRDSDYFPADKDFMINLRVRGLEALLGELREVGIEVTTKAEWDDPTTGRFARIHDPEGNPIELWEPPAAG